MQTSPDTLFIFAGGGTGGHLFPGLAVAERIRERLGERAEMLFLCSRRPIDRSILEREGASFTPVPAAPPGLGPRAMWRFVRGWGPSLREGRSVVRSARKAGRRVVVVTTGGFVAAPIVQAARVEKCPVVMLNLDAVPGRANRWIARHACRVHSTVALEGGARLRTKAQVEVVPPIVRRAALARGSPASCRESFGLDPATPTLLVTGGSQGAASINEFMEAFAGQRGESLRGWQVLHQTGGSGSVTPGEEDGATQRAVVAVEDAYREAGVRARVVAFVGEMGRAWGAAELCVCRAGAGNVAEAWATRTPCVFMPYPYHRDEHQRLNAQPLAAKGAAMLVRDAIGPEANMEEAGRVLGELLGDAAARARMVQALVGLGPADGAERVASGVVGLVQGM